MVFGDAGGCVVAQVTAVAGSVLTIDSLSAPLATLVLADGSHVSYNTSGTAALRTSLNGCLAASVAAAAGNAARFRGLRVVSVFIVRLQWLYE